jgi:fucose 4-O-acetylase-like acetyltransferase
MGERIGWLDTARAIGIVAVVAGHVTSDRAVWAAAFHFHMPLFFMLSGMMAGPAPLGEVAWRRVRSLLIPYACWLVIVASADLVIASATSHPAYLPWDRPAVAIARALLGGTFLVGPFGIFWFVTCLYLVQVAGTAILRLPQHRIVLATAALFVVAQLIPRWPNPWGVISVPMALFFFLFGALHHGHVDRLGRWPIVAAAVFAALALLSRPLDMKIADAGTPVLSMLAALGLCHLVITIARHLPGVAPVAVVGRASLAIMYLHLTLLYALRGRLGEGTIAAIGIALPLALWLALRRYPCARVVLFGERLARPAARDPTPRPTRLPLSHEQA